MQFGDLIAPLAANEFRDSYLGRRPIHVPGERRPRLDMLDWPRFNEALGQSYFWNEDTLKVYFKSRAALRENYCDTEGAAPNTRAPVNPAKVRALLGLGASLVANHLHRVCPSIATVVSMLEREFAARVFANAYCSFKGVQAFQTHFDLHDVFACQIEGEKTWRVYEARADAPIAPLPPGDEVEKWLVASRGKLLFEVVMKPGDILYLPRGQYHDALTGAAASLHVTFGVSPANGLALFPLLEKLLQNEAAFRAYLPDARQQGASQKHLALLAERVRFIMTSPAFLADVRTMQADLARPARVDYGLPEQLAPSWFSVAKPAQVVRGDKGYAVVFQGGEFALGEAYATVEWVLQQRVFSFEDALARQPGLDPRALHAEFAKLVQAGIVAATDMR